MLSFRLRTAASQPSHLSIEAPRPCRLHSAFFTLLMLCHQLLCRNLLSPFSVLVISVQLLVLDVDNTVSQGLNHFHSQLVLIVSRQTRGRRKTSSPVLKQSIQIVQRLMSTSCGPREPSKPGLSRIPPVVSFYSLLGRKCRTQPVLVHRVFVVQILFLFSTFRGILFSVSIRFSMPNQLSQKLEFLDQKKGAQCFSVVGARHRKKSKRSLRDLESSLAKPVAACCLPESCKKGEATKIRSRLIVNGTAFRY